MDSSLKSKRTVTTLLMLAMLFIILGIGNILYGSIKYTQYVQLLENMRSVSNESDQMPSFPLLPAEPPQELSEHELRHVYSRLSFYELVTLGGKSFLGIAGVFLLLCLLTLKQPQKHLTDEYSA